MDDPEHFAGVLAEIKREITPLRALQHPRVVAFVGVVYGPLASMGDVDVPKYLLMEKVDGGTLHDALYEPPARGGGRPRQVARTQQPMKDILRQAEELAQAVDYIHLQGCMHRDIKPKNILLTAMDHHIKLADLGLAKIIEVAQGDNQSLTQCGTPAYLAPEIIGGRYSNKVDVYSAALVVAEIIHRGGCAAGVAAHRDLVEQAVSQFPGLADALRGGSNADPERRLSSAAFLRAVVAAPAAGRLEPGQEERRRPRTAAGQEERRRPHTAAAARIPPRTSSSRDAPANAVIQVVAPAPGRSPSTPHGAVLRAVGAGEDSVNGYYKANGEYRGKPRYIKVRGFDCVGMHRDKCAVSPSV